MYIFRPVILVMFVCINYLYNIRHELSSRAVIVTPPVVTRCNDSDFMTVNRGHDPVYDVRIIMRAGDFILAGDLYQDLIVSISCKHSGHSNRRLLPDTPGVAITFVGNDSESSDPAKSEDTVWHR